MLNQLMSHTTSQKNKQQASTEHAKSAYVTHNKPKKLTKKASTEHAQSAYVTHNKPKKQTNRPQQNMLNQSMSHTSSQKNKLKGFNRKC
jgi:ERCC4-type nuclease